MLIAGTVCHAFGGLLVVEGGGGSGIKYEKRQIIGQINEKIKAAFSISDSGAAADLSGQERIMVLLGGRGVPTKDR